MNELARLPDVTVETPGDQIARLVRSGGLIPVQVFGSCHHPVAFPSGTDTCEDPEHWSYGLSDRFSEHAIAGSDCNRAAFFILRPSDELMTGDPVIRAALSEVLEDPDEDLS